MNELNGLVVRPAGTQEEAEAAIMPVAYAEEAWFIDEKIISVYRKLDPECVIIALLNDIPVGCVVAPAWDNSVGGIAFLGVHKEHRNKGIAARLGAAAIARIRSHKTSSICITSLPVNVPEYRKQGFEQAGPSIQFWSYLETQPSFNHNQATEEALEYLPSAIELAAIDTKHTGIDRPRLWQSFIDQRARFLRIYSDSKLVAWTIFHSFHQQCALAPLYAEKPEQARALVQKAIRDLGERELVIEADATPNSEKLFAELGFRKSSITAVYMWNGSPRLPNENTVYAGLQGF